MIKLSINDALDVVRRILSEYPSAEDLEKVIENSGDPLLKRNKYLLLWLYDRLIENSGAGP